MNNTDVSRCRDAASIQVPNFPVGSPDSLTLSPELCSPEELPLVLVSLLALAAMIQVSPNAPQGSGGTGCLFTWRESLL